VAAYAAVADTYERRRPSYSPQVVAWVIEKLGLGPGATVVDVGAGTGKLTRLLVPSEARILAVEPLDEMRARLVAAAPTVEALAGSAEALPLPDAAADAITVACAMHWFDLDRALPEFHRVLRPGARFAVVAQARDLDQPLQVAIQQIIGRYLPDLAELGGWRETVQQSSLFELVDQLDAGFEQRFDAEGLAERIGTISYIARLPDDERANVLARVRALGGTQAETPFPFRYRTLASVYERRDED
jgi:ubiquinone/menaquinone biosynthesis C-methylase UbiE